MTLPEWVPWLEYGYRWDAIAKRYVVTKRGSSLAGSWENCPARDHLIVVPGDDEQRDTAKRLVAMLNDARRPEQLPGSEVTP